MKFKLLLIPAFTFFFLLSGCGVLQQLNEAQNFAKCEFKLATVNDIKVAGINFQKVDSKSDLALTALPKIVNAFSSNSFPLTLTLNLDVKNPNTTAAAMNNLDWILLIDDIQMVTGAVNERVDVPASGQSTFPIKIEVDLKQALSGKSFDSMLNFAFNLAGEGNKPTRFMLKAKPSINVGSYNLKYPGYIDVQTEFTAAEGKGIRDAVIK